MNDLMRYAADLEGVLDDHGAPKGLADWNPPFCGDIDMVICADGTWTYGGTPIGRARLVRLFSTVLRKEGDKYFLVTPVEKLGIRVEEAPFVAVLMRVENEGRVNGDAQRLVFTTNVGDEVVAGKDFPIDYRPRPHALLKAVDGPQEAAPYLHVRAGLEALISRSVFFDLVAVGERRHIDEESLFGVSSNGAFFPFAPTAEISI